MYSAVKIYCDKLTAEFDRIPAPRKKLLSQLSDYILLKLQKNEQVQLVYICTHNSRRSHFGQIWSRIAADYFMVKKIATYSGGTEVTRFNSNSVNALKRIGFITRQVSEGVNPKVDVYYDENLPALTCFSKTFDDPANPSDNFVAIMTCGEAERNCPFIPGADARISCTYQDPKAFDNTPQQDNRYDECCRLIARETFYVFSALKN